MTQCNFRWHIRQVITEQSFYTQPWDLLISITQKIGFSSWIASNFSTSARIIRWSKVSSVLTLKRMLSKICGQKSTNTMPDITVRLPITVSIGWMYFRAISLHLIEFVLSLSNLHRARVDNESVWIFSKYTTSHTHSESTTICLKPLVASQWLNVLFQHRERCLLISLSKNEFKISLFLLVFLLNCCIALSDSICLKKSHVAHELEPASDVFYLNRY